VFPADAADPDRDPGGMQAAQPAIASLTAEVLCGFLSISVRWRCSPSSGAILIWM